MHDYDYDLYQQMYQHPVMDCWYCGRRGRLHRGGPFMVCGECDVMWARWQRPVITVTYAPMYEAA